ncbi:FadR/GntR family transcriptional regulator [Phytohabitans kaempferiae]|uniref:FadR/GntR family transcriptional regulator n=1 Tax=Phytohabitans kaempferiae TaxID=1620943 RepID=A0ABV6M3C3_9ACTN
MHDGKDSLMQPVPQSGLIGDTIAELRRLIATGYWKVGDRLPTEADLASSLGIGRNTLREAVRALVHAGLLDTRHGRGTYVKSNDEIGPTLARYLRQEDLNDILETRRVLEPEAAALAAMRRDDAAVAAIAKAYQRLTVARSTAAIVEADVDFHTAIVAATGNPVLLRLYGGLADVLRSSVETLSRGHSRAIASHGKLVEAIRDGDPDAARAAARAHFDRAMSGDGEDAATEGGEHG